VDTSIKNTNGRRQKSRWRSKPLRLYLICRGVCWRWGSSSGGRTAPRGPGAWHPRLAASGLSCAQQCGCCYGHGSLLVPHGTETERPLVEQGRRNKPSHEPFGSKLQLQTESRGVLQV
jgi:hypothetical protein